MNRERLRKPDRRIFSRRELFGRMEHSLGAIAFAQLLAGDGPLANDAYRPTIDGRRPHAPRPSPETARAKRVLLIFCAGAVSQLETWDYKPELARRDGQALPGGPAVTFQGPAGALARPQYEFRPRGECGKMVSDLLPHLGGLVDELAFIHSLTSRSNTHGPAENYLSTGFTEDGFPSLGAWTTYALGSENEELPAFVSIPDPRGVPQASVNNWGPGFLPAVFQGTPFTASEAIRDLSPPASISARSDAASRRLLRVLEDEHLARHPGDPELAARIASYELAARLQLSIPAITDLAGEPAHILASYGAGDPDPIRSGFARNCILARRLLEHGVRFVQLFNGAYASAGRLNWDGHQDIRAQYDVHGRVLDQPAAALIRDLDQRGLLDDTLVVWATEFGRMPMFQKGAKGRDHNPNGFTVFLTGAGVKRGTSVGRTDELGFRAVEDVFSMHDLHATILYLLGLDHERLTYRHNGVERRLTDVHGHVIEAILA